MAEAAGYGSQLVVFPEAFIGGYPRGSNFGVTIGNRTAKGKEEFRKYHASAIDVPGQFILCLCLFIIILWMLCKMHFFGTENAFKMHFLGHKLL